MMGTRLHFWQGRGWEGIVGKIKDQQCRKNAMGRQRSWLRLWSSQGTSLSTISNHPGQGRAYVKGTNENSNWHHRERGHCTNSPLIPNLITLLPRCYFSIHYYPPKPCSHATSSRKPSKMPPVRLTFFPTYLFSATPPSITALTYCLSPCPDHELRVWHAFVTPSSQRPSA